MSGINLDKNLLFIHIAKTAGTSMESFDFIPGLGHRPLSYYRDLLTDVLDIDYDNLFKFAFVRNPYDRFASASLHHIPEKDINSKTLEKFIIDNYSRIKDIEWEDIDFNMHFIPMYKSVCIDAKLDLDFCGKYERLQKDWSRLCKIIGVKEELPHKRKSGINYDGLYTRKYRKLIRDLYREDFELFNYG